MKNTKQIIVLKSLEHFNTFGAISTSLQKIADDVGISIGNLNYHYKNREALILALFDMLDADIYSVLENLTQELSEEEIIDIEYQLILLQEKYKFVFLDVTNLIHISKDIEVRFTQNMNLQIDVLTSLMQLGSRMGTFKIEKREGEYLQLARLIWSIYFFRISREQIMKSTYQLDDMVKDIWLVIAPFLTEKGLKEYKPLLKAKSGIDI